MGRVKKLFKNRFFKMILIAIIVISVGIYVTINIVKDNKEKEYMENYIENMEKQDLEENKEE